LICLLAGLGAAGGFTLLAGITVDAHFPALPGCQTMVLRPRCKRGACLFLRPEYAEIHSFGFDGTGHSA
jgi:hypothetical protein